VRSYVLEHLGRPDGVLIADDTSAIKQGAKSAGVARQYCGLTGQVENCQVMPMLTYASATGHAFVNRRLYLPESWANDPRRRKEAGIPADLLFATKPALVIDMLGEEISAGTPFRYLCGGCGYGRDPGLRTSSGKVERRLGPVEQRHGDPLGQRGQPQVFSRGGSCVLDHEKRCPRTARILGVYAISVAEAGAPFW
jgi:SRSO17 transposase